MIQLTNEQLERLKNRLEGLCSGAYMGDLLGFPWEQLSPEEILEKTGGRGIEGTHTPFKPRLLGSQWGDRTEYRTSDDWRLTMAVGKALIRERSGGGVSLLMAHAIEHLEAMEEDRTGWGPTILAGLEPLRTFFRTDGLGGRHPSDPVAVTVTNQSGTGPLMKTSLMALPILLAQLGPRDSFPSVGARALRDLYQLGRMTHAGDAVLLTIPYALLIAQFLDPRRTLSGSISFVQLERWKQLLTVRVVGSEQERRRAIQLCDAAFAGVAIRHPWLFRDGSPRADPFRTQLRLVDVHTVNRSLAENAFDPSKIGLTGAQYALAQALFLHDPKRSLAEVVLDAVNRGGDADTDGCIAGAYAGAFRGWSEADLPEDWKERDQPARAFANELHERYVIPNLAGL